MKKTTGKTIFGIQGGEGSFNEQALLQYIAKLRRTSAYSIRHLFTTERVLRELHEGNIDFGLFAIQNATGGLVKESIKALSRYNFAIREEIPFLVRHFLMRRKDAARKKPGVIMAHDQVFRQCARTLKERYPRARLVTGKGDLMDTARAARALHEGALPKKTFILGPKPLAALYDLEIVDRDLQDNKNNETTFLLVSRPFPQRTRKQAAQKH